MDDLPKSRVLDYANPRSEPAAWRRGLHFLWRAAGLVFDWLPLWIVALVLMIPSVLVLCMAQGRLSTWPISTGLFYAGLFLPGAVKRRSWRAGLMMLGLAAVAFALNRLTREVRWPANDFWRAWLFNGVCVLLVGAGEMLARWAWSRRTLAWVAGMSIAAAALMTGIAYCVQFQRITVRIPIVHNTWRLMDLSFVVSPFTVAAVTWIALPLGMRMAVAGRRKRVIVCGASLALVGAFLLFFGSLVYTLAERSISGWGPFSPAIGAGILSVPGTDAARERIWRGLEASDWTRRYTHPEDGDWRQWIIKSFYRGDPAGTAGHLAEIFQRHPSRILAHYASEALIAQKRYETFGWLVRYGVLPRFAPDLELAHNLAEARIPQAILGEISYWNINSRGELELLPDDWTGGDRLRGPGSESIANLLGAQAPQTRREALELFWKLQGAAASPLPPAQQAEVSRLMNCLARYQQAWRGEHFDLRSPEPDWDHASIDQLEKQVDDRVAELMAARGEQGGLPVKRFAVVMIDDATEKELGPFPYDRAVLAEGIEALAEAKARGVVLKFFLDLRKSAQGDAALAGAMKNVKVILQARIDDSQADPNPLPPRFVLPNPDMDEVTTMAGKSGWLPLPELSANAYDLGFIDSTTSIELVPLVEEYQGKYVKSLYLSALELATGKPATIKSGFAIEMKSKQNGVMIPRFNVQLGKEQIPTDTHCLATIKLPPADNLQPYSFIDLIHHKIPAEKLADRVIILGYDGAKMETNKTSIGMVKGHRIFCYQLFSLFNILRPD